MQESVYQTLPLTITQSERMLFITGIPRSGTSLLASLVSQLPNIVVLNEPREMVQIFRDPTLRDFYTAYMTWRRHIADGKPVENQWINGKVATDTWNDGERRLHVPNVTRPDFVLGTKNPLTYLTRLQTIRQMFPGAKIVVLVRHPYYTIGSWKQTFPHLRHASIRDSAVFQFANGRQQEILALLDQIDDEPMRRAALWNYLAKEIIAWAEPATILKYEDLIARPASYVEGLYRSFFTDQPPRFTSDLHTRNDTQRYTLGDDDLKCIRSQCGESAALLGYDGV